jgi:hypothetical protein
VFAALAAEELAEDVAKRPASAPLVPARGAALLIDVFGKIEATESHAGLGLPRHLRRQARPEECDPNRSRTDRKPGASWTSLRMS